MPAAAMTVGLRPRSRPGPALRRLPIPFVSLALSALAHGVLAAAIILGALMWKASQPRTYVVNLVPAVPAVGTPQPQETRPAPTPAPVPPAPRATAEPPPRPEPRPLPERPAVRDLPDRTA
ncbi:MAG TPA: hypothetical protein VNO23_02770, partial [Candidatus Binatia bacterium]|nr:hypothetical protein [Candidatus Binatia bacterium]